MPHIKLRFLTLKNHVTAAAVRERSVREGEPMVLAKHKLVEESPKVLQFFDEDSSCWQDVLHVVEYRQDSESQREPPI